MALLEYGSPVRPRVMEAEIIHMIDNLECQYDDDVSSARPC